MMAGALPVLHPSTPGTLLRTNPGPRDLSRDSCGKIRTGSGPTRPLARLAHISSALPPVQRRQVDGTAPGPLQDLETPHIRGPLSAPYLRRRSSTIVAARGADDGVRWWEKEDLPNMRDLHSTQDFVEALSGADDELVIVEFYATWCGSCRALFPKLCKIAEAHPNIRFFKVNFDENKPMCKSLNIKVLPYFHFYRGSEGRLDAFSASISKLQRLKDAIETHNTERCSLGPVMGVGDLDLSAGAAADKKSADLSAAAGAR